MGIKIACGQCILNVLETEENVNLENLAYDNIRRDYQEFLQGSLPSKTPTKDGAIAIAIATRNTLGLFIQPQPYSWEIQTVKSGNENSFFTYLFGLPFKKSSTNVHT